MSESNSDRLTSPNGLGEPSYTTSGFEQRKKEIERTQKALADRPNFSVGMQISLCFIVSFAVIFGFACAQLIAMRMMENEIRCLETANQYLFEIQRARSFKQNYIQFGANLDETLESVRLAKSILGDGSRQLKLAVEEETYRTIVSQLDQYSVLLQNLTVLDALSESMETNDRKTAVNRDIQALEIEMRSSIQQLILEEENALNRLIHLSGRVHLYSLFILFLIILFFTFLLARRILARINRFVKYTQRIATGDYTLIIPARSYRDEFSDLAAAINQMILELELRQDVLVQSHKLKAMGTLTAGIAHELNNPLNNISLTAYMMKEDFDTLPNPERLEMIDDVIHETERSKRIVKHLLDFARESEISLEPLDIREVIQETLDLTANQANLKRVHIDFKMVPNLPLVNGDQQQLCQVFLNVFLNALDVTSKGGRIGVEVGLSKTAKFVTVKVTDSGPGIPDHVIPSIFDPFFTTKGGDLRL